MGKLISVSFVFSYNIWVVCSQLLSVEGILFCNGSQNAFGGPWFVLLLLLKSPAAAETQTPATAE